MGTIKADVAIIGSGQGASPLARALVDEGQEVVIFERDRWGGTCVNYGCIPSKTFLASAHAAAGARHAAALGVQATVSVDFPAIMERVQKTLQPSRQGVKRGLEAAGVRTVEAEARIVEPNRVIGGDVTVEAPTIVLNTGKSPLVPPISGLEETP